MHRDVTNQSTKVCFISIAVLTYRMIRLFQIGLDQIYFPNLLSACQTLKVISTIEFDDHVMCLDNDDVCKS